MSTTACAEPGCTGSILDGYCDVCGSPAAPTSSAAPTSNAPPAGAASTATAPAGVAHSPSTVSRASNRLASTALGSARAGAGGSSVTRRVGTSSTRLRGARLGAGLTTIPPVAAVDAAKAVLENPMVPEDRRTCPSCGSPVGRSRDGQPGRTEGFCPSFVTVHGGSLRKPKREDVQAHRADANAGRTALLLESSQACR